MSALVEIDSLVPFGSLLYCRLHLLGHDLAHLEHEHRYDPAYLAWETVRQQTNPFFEHGTGFEGYLVGTCRTSDEALDEILHIAHQILEGIAHTHRFEYGFRNQLMRTLTGESDDEHCLSIWSTWLGVILAQLRCRVLQNQEAYRFRLETYHLISGLPPIQYHENQQVIWQHYNIPREANHNHRLNVSITTLPPKEQEAWLVARSIGRFGHPLFRALMVGAPTIHYFQGERTPF